MALDMAFLMVSMGLHVIDPEVSSTNTISLDLISDFLGDF
jgi:hypothetical protein